MTVVQEAAQHRLAGGDERQRAGRWHAEVEHRLAAHELAQRRAQHRAAIRGARVRRRPGALQLELPRLAGVADLAERDRASVAELAGPRAELMAAVTRCVWRLFGVE